MKPTERGDFDALTLKRMEDTIAERIALFEKELSDGEQSKADRTASVAEAETVREGSESKRTASARILSQSQEELKECERAVQEAQHAANNLVPELEAILSERESEQNRLSSFQRSALANFDELRKRTKPVLEPEECVEHTGVDLQPAKMGPEKMSELASSEIETSLVSMDALAGGA